MATEEKKLVLMIDDNEDDFVLIRDMVEESAPGRFELRWAQSFAQGLAMLAESVYAVAFLDYRLGDGDGLQFLKEASARDVKTPIIILTGKGNDGVGVEAIRRGASDYLVKDELTCALVERSIRHAIERGKMIEALTASEEKFRAVFEDSGISIALTDIDGSISDTNACFQDMFGTGGGSLHGLSLTSLVYPDDQQSASCAFTKLLKGVGTCASVESRYIGYGGRTLWGRTLLSSISDESGNIRKVAVMISDITKDKWAEEQISNLARFPEQNPFPVIRIDSDGVITYANKTSAPILDTWGVALGKKVPAGVMGDCVSSLSSRLLHEIEVDCGGRVFSLVLSPVPEMGYVNVYGREITDWKKAERKLLLAAKVYESAMDGIVVTDQDGVILSVNPAFTKITGFTAAEAVGKKSSILKSGHHDADFYKDMWDRLQNEGSWKGEMWNRRKNGETYPQWMTIASVTGDNGAISQYVGVFQDVTDIKEYQEEISYHAYHDPLTGLPNRLLFDDRLTHAIATANRDNKKVALMYIDLDGFKQINDIHGHNIGDLVLKGVAVRLASILREGDTISRIGGDEFIVLLENVGHRRNLKLVTEKILSAVKEPFFLKGSEVSVGASLGVVMFPCEVQDSEALIKRADAAMYAAKQGGKDQVVFYGDLTKKRDNEPPGLPLGG